MKRQRDAADDAQGDAAKRARSGPRQAGGDARVRTLKTQREEDPHRLAQRQKQIDYGKNTLGYDRYCALVPRHMRRKGEHPMTPDKTLSVSKKHFDSMIRRWRQALHAYDPPELTERLQAAEIQAAETPSRPAGQETSSAPADQPDSDPELADLDPSKQSTSSTAPSIFETFQEDDTIPVDFEDDDDDDLL